MLMLAAGRVCEDLWLGGRWGSSGPNKAAGRQLCIQHKPADAAVAVNAVVLHLWRPVFATAFQRTQTPLLA